MGRGGGADKVDERKLTEVEYSDCLNFEGSERAGRHRCGVGLPGVAHNRPHKVHLHLLGAIFEIDKRKCHEHGGGR